MLEVPAHVEGGTRKWLLNSRCVCETATGQENSHMYRYMYTNSRVYEICTYTCYDSLHVPHSGEVMDNGGC